jgi:prolyl-tRNA synthetase
VRPTPETIIGEAMARWTKSYRDLPPKLNQWGNVVRWEMRPRLILCTSEFLWQEGHTVHPNRAEAADETNMMLDVHRRVVEGDIRIPVIPLRLRIDGAKANRPGAHPSCSRHTHTSRLIGE